MKKTIFILYALSFFGCESAKNSTSSKITTEANLLKSKEEGYFKAVGIDSTWTVEISEQSIRFNNLTNGEEIMVPHVEPLRAADSNVKMYNVQKENNNLQIIINHQPCEIKDKKLAYKVEVKMMKKENSKEKNFSGCGEYCIDYRLYDSWVLESLKGKEINSKQNNRDLPSIEINSSSKRIEGFSGCNRFSGKVFQERELLRFTNIMSTKMACENLSFEDKFLKAIQQSTGYKIKNNRLLLTQSNQIIAIFRKID